ncbi:MAG TPA: cytochrome c3 family protein [Rhodocyclaceae bacterium]|nr:cytochrome c3 family protein [Rhodocyclaceae bacterium]
MNDANFKVGVRSLLRWAGAAVLALGVSTAAVAGISATKHNLGTTQTVGNRMTTGTSEICVFCHTPHASSTSVSAPLWNKAVPASNTFTTYSTANSSTIDGAVSLGSISLACLSCHDGSQAMDNMINQPGSGGYAAGGAVLPGGVWAGANQTAGQMTGVANLGKDLSNDHPVGIQYCGGGISTGSADKSAASTGSCTDVDFVAPLNTTINSTRVWWVETGGGTTRTKSDMILYGQTVTNWQPMVECGSCHDPHSTNTTFLRIANTGSAVCLACHNK